MWRCALAHRADRRTSGHVVLGMTTRTLDAGGIPPTGHAHGHGEHSGPFGPVAKAVPEPVTTVRP